MTKSDSDDKKQLEDRWLFIFTTDLYFYIELQQNSATYENLPKILPINVKACVTIFSEKVCAISRLVSGRLTLLLRI